MRIKLIAVDLDGTLLNPRGELDAETVSAARACMERGARFVLSSGRMPGALRRFCDALRVNAPAVCYNGGALVEIGSGKVLFSTPVPLDLARDIAKTAEDMGLYFHAFIHGGYIAPYYCEKTEAYEKLSGVKAEVVNGAISEKMDEAPMKLLILDTPEGAAKALPVLKEKFAGRANILQNQKHMIECVDKNTGKAGALQYLIGRLGISNEETCAFGDGMNDLDMLRWAAYPYVMETASDAVKKADSRFLRAPSNARAGVAMALEALMNADLIGD